MAEQSYKYTKEDKRGEVVETKTIPLQDMTTRMLRKYIRENAAEANERLNTIKDLSDTSQAFQDQIDYLKSFGSGRGGGIKSDTSRIDKETMVEYAFALRDLNQLDTYSKYSRDQDYKENKQRYETFMQNQLNSLNPKTREYWSQYLTPKGNISKRGYQDYKNFVNWLSNIDEVIATYGYETIKDLYMDQADKEDQKKVADLVTETYVENLGKGLTGGQVTDQLYDKIADFKAKKTTGGKKSTTNVKVKSAGKMKGGKVRNKQTT